MLLKISVHWRPVVRSLINILEYRRKRLGLLPVKIVNIYQKWGVLCFFTEGHDNIEDAWISAAALQCTKICEECGSKENVAPCTGSKNRKFNFCKYCRV